MTEKHIKLPDMVLLPGVEEMREWCRNNGWTRGDGRHDVTGFEEWERSDGPNAMVHVFMPTDEAAVSYPSFVKGFLDDIATIELPPAAIGRAMTQKRGT